MIEFKAECGHTVRARDEDAGGVVRCSYCGRNAAVPDNHDAGLDFLFRELEETAEPDKSYKKPKKRRGRKLFSRKGASAEGFDPFGIVLKLCYVAGLIIIVWVVVQKAVMPLIRGESPIKVFANRQSEPPPVEEVTRRERVPKKTAGLIGEARTAGLYVASVPTGATVYCIEQQKAPTKGRIAGLSGVRQMRTDGSLPHVNDGAYLVEVTLPWHDRNLSAYKDYWDFRRAVEHATEDKRRQLLEEYFIPDDATDVFIYEADDQIYLVRQYRADVRRDQSKGIHALFLPRIKSGQGKAFAVEPLVRDYIPDAKRYEFDEDHVSGELGYYGVSPTDRTLVIEALRRAGAISYMTPDGKTRLFRIGIDDGVFATKVVRESPP